MLTAVRAHVIIIVRSGERLRGFRGMNRNAKGCYLPVAVVLVVVVVLAVLLAVVVVAATRKSKNKLMWKQ